MFAAIVADMVRIPNTHVVTTWDARLGRCPCDSPAVTAVPVRNPETENLLFQSLAAEADATYLIAPEFDGILASRSRLVEKSCGRLLGCSIPAIKACSDKLQLGLSLANQRIRSIDTRPFDTTAPAVEMAFPFVLKPRDGAGSQDTFLVRNVDDFEHAWRMLAESGRHRAIQQPYVSGTAVSIAVLLGSTPDRIDIFPLALQRQTDDGRFTYLGGQIPFRWPATERVEAMIYHLVRIVPGLCGYVGFDLILPCDGPPEPVLVEINPRLTTSYIGYRNLAIDNIAQRILFPDREFPPIRWKSGIVDFRADGHVVSNSPRAITT